STTLGSARLRPMILSGHDSAGRSFRERREFSGVPAQVSPLKSVLSPCLWGNGLRQPPHKFTALKAQAKLLPAQPGCATFRVFRPFRGLRPGTVSAPPCPDCLTFPIRLHSFGSLLTKRRKKSLFPRQYHVALTSFSTNQMVGRKDCSPCKS